MRRQKQQIPRTIGVHKLPSDQLTPSGFCPPLRAASASSVGYPLATLLPFCSHNLMQAGRPSNSRKPTVQISHAFRVISKPV